MSDSELIWRGDETQDEVERVLVDAMREIGLRIEGEAKKELYPGHGKVTGTLQRSVHAAGPDYNFAGDNTRPGPATPHRGGDVEPEVRRGRVSISVGSGMEYALIIHTLYQYITIALSRVAPRALDIIAKHAQRRRAS